MADNTQTYTTRIFLNAEEAKKQLDELQSKVETLRKKKDEAARAGDWPTFNSLKKQLDQANNQIRSMQTSAQKIDRVLGNLSTASVKEIQQSIKAINAELSSGAIERGSKEWNFLQEQLKRCNQELKNIRGEHALTTTSWQKFFKFLNDSWGGILILFQSISGLSTTIRKSVTDFANMEEAMADVRKYTGLTDEGVRELNEDLKKMDTRTSREELNQLAGAAGRLGITETKMVEEFVDGADKIRVALGDDLGEGAVDTIGKLAIAFGEDKNKGLRGAMLATGSALNELVQSSPAQAQPIIEFTSKLSGVGQQAHMSQAQIMGFAAALDQNNQEMATSSTVMSQLITKMYQDPARFAKMAGMEVKSFAQLVKTDMNQALIEWLQHVNSLGDMSVLAGKFDELKMDGTRAVGVLATLAGHIDQVTEAQRTATKAYEEGTSVIKEFDVQNSTVQAQTEKAKKRFHELTIELGEKLLPVVKYTINGSSMLVKGLSVLINFTEKHWKLLLSLVSLIAIYNATLIKTTIATKAHAAATAIADIATKAYHATTVLLRSALVALKASWALLTKGVKGYTIVMRAARMASLTNPWTALATVLTGVGIAVTAMIKAWRSYREELRMQDPAYRAAKQHAKDMADISKQVNSEVAKEMATITHLTNVIRSNAYSIGDRRGAIAELQKIVPGYHASITNEGKLIETNTGKLTDYINELKRAAKAQAYMDKMTEIAQKKLDNELKLSRKQYNLKAVDAELQRGERMGDKNPYKSELEVQYYGLGTTPSLGEGNQKRIDKLKERATQEKAVNDALKERETILRREAELEKAMKKDGILAPITVTGTKPTPPEPKPTPTPTPPTKTEAELKKRVDAAKAEYQAELAEEMMAYRQGITTYTAYMEERHQITQNYYDEMKRIYGGDSTEYKELLDNREKEEGEYYQWKAKRNDEQLVRERLERERSLHRQFEDERSEAYHNQDVLEEALFKSEMQYLRDKQKLYKNGSKEWEELEMQINQKQEQHKFDLQQQYIQRLAKYREDTGRINYQQLQEIELKGVETMYGALLAAGKMTRDEYDAIIEHIKRKYAELEANQTADNNVKSRASKSIETATKKAGVEDVGAGNDAATGIFSIKSAIEQQRAVNEQLKQLYGDDYKNNEEYQEAKRQLNLQTMQSIVAGAQAAYQSINTMMSAASSLAQANSDLEVAKITANYDKQIEAAGKNSKKRERLEKERDEKIAKAKTKANKKAMAMEIAQAIAQTAMGAISAYSSTMAGAPFPANLVLAPISAGIALAAGAMQIATIKKQHQAEAMGYYEGGFTGGRRYRREAGVVHEGEFVANHQAVANPAVLPFLNFLDEAQRNNTVGSLTMQDVSRAAGGGAPTVVAPVVNVQTDNSELSGTLAEARDVLDRLTTQLEQGIGVDIPIDGENGIYRRMKRYENLLKNK